MDGPGIDNLASAHFECVYPKCDGICCRNGRPAIEDVERERIAAHLPKFLPHLLPAARARVERSGFATRRLKEGLPTLAVEDGWCVFFNQGCVLHKVGAEEGDRFRYKPWRCAVFPLERDRKRGTWHVRQWGHKGEAWDLFCLNPTESPRTAAETLAGEVELATEVERRLGTS